MLSRAFMRASLVLGSCALLISPVASRALASRAPAAMPVTIFGQWTAGEKTDFLAITHYCDTHYHTKTTYQQSSGDYNTNLQTRVQGGHAPDLATLSTPSSIAPYVQGGALSPVTFVNTAKFKKQYSSFWRKLGTINGKLYAIYMKADVKSLVWYSPKKFSAGHYSIPKTWSQLLSLSSKMVKQGKQPWAFGVGGSPASPWTLTDFLENIMLSTYGPKVYQQWINHKISWTGAQLRNAMKTFAKIVGNNSMIAGGRSTALSQDWSTAATQMVNDPKAEFWQEATFTEAGLLTTLPKDKPAVDYSAFAFPMIKHWKTTPVEVGPNGVVMFHDTPGARALVTCLTDPNALAQWAKRGGFISPNNATPLSAYPDPVLRMAAQLMVKAGKDKLLVGDASDLMPVSLGSDFEFTELQKWFQNPSPSNTTSILKALESFAKTAYK